MLKPRTRIARIRRREAVRAFLCGTVWGIAISMAAIIGGGPTIAAALMALAVAGLCVMILGLHIGALRRAKEDSADMLRSVDAGLIVLDQAEICVSIGGKLCELLEMPADWDPTGLSISQILTELASRGDLGPRVPPSLPVDAALFRSPAFADLYVETPGGRIVSVAVSELPQGGWVLTYTDVTAYKEQTRMVLRAQRELEASEARARQLARDADAANAAKSGFLAAIGHEIRTPMTAILGLSEVLADSDLGEDQLAQVTTIRDSCESLLVIINDILDFSKIEAGRMTLECAPFNLRAAIEGVLKLVGLGARQRGLAVLLDYDPDLPEDFVGDSIRLRQILINLVGNAVKFTPEGSVVVRATGRQCGDRFALEIAVDDTGIGIAEEHLAHIFGEFARVEGARRFEGTGLGLAICKQLAAMMSGEIDVQSELDVGTTFTLRLELPVFAGEMLPAPGRARQATAATLPAPVPGTRRLLVVLAEDNRTNQAVLSLMLENEPVDLRIARTGREAVALFAELMPDLVLMDVCMPDMDGFAATGAIRQLERERGLPRVPILALTAYSGHEHRARCIEHDMDDYLPKPLHKPDLVAMVLGYGLGIPMRDPRVSVPTFDFVAAAS